MLTVAATKQQPYCLEIKDHCNIYSDAKSEISANGRNGEATNEQWST